MGLCIGNFNNNILPTSVKESIGADTPMYGVKFDGTNSAGIRTYDAATLNWTPSTSSVAGVDDFANLAPFNVKECITQYNSNTGEREVLAYKGDSNWASLVASKTGDRMIEFPVFYYRRPSKYEFIVSPTYKPGFQPSPWHYRKGVLKEVRRISKYNIDTNFASQTGTSPRVDTNMNTFRTNLRAKGWYMMDYVAWYSLSILMLVKYANMNLQSTVGLGYSAVVSSVTDNGKADTVLGLDGSKTSVTTYESVLTFGIENFYSNLWKFLDGIYGYGGYLYKKDVEDMTSDPTSASDLTGGTYEKINTAVVASANNSAISDISYDTTHPHLMFPTAVGAPNPSGDACWTNTNFNCTLSGGAVNYELHSGLFTFNINYNVGAVSSYVGCCAIE